METKLQIHNGRPEDCSNRIKNEIRSYDLLDSLGIKYIRADHAPTATIEACAEVEEALQVPISKNLFLTTANKTEFYLYIVPGHKKFKTGFVSRQAGSSRLSFASENYLKTLLDLTPGSVTVLGLMNDTEQKVKLLIDEDILKQKYIGMHPCINTSSIRISSKDFFEKLLPALNRQYTVIKSEESI